MAGRRIAGITVEIGGDTTKLQTALKGVNTTIKDTQSKLKDINKLLKLDPSNTELLSQKQKTLGTAIGATKEKLEALKTASEQAKQQMENGDLGADKYDALQREIVATEQELQNLAKEAANANQTLTKIGDVGRTLQTVGDSVSGVGKSLTKNVTTPLVGIGTAAIKTTADFDSQMCKVSAISGATGKDFDALRSKAREMGAKTKFSATEAGQGFEYMAMAGWKTGDMLDGIDGIMNLAAASGEDLGTTSDIVTDALTGFGLSAKDAGHFADVLAVASSNSNTNVALMGETFKYAAPIAGALGVSVEDAAESIGLMANAGIKGSQAGTSLRSIMTRISTDAGASSKKLGALGTITEKLGVQVYDSSGNMRDWSDIIDECRNAWGGLSDEEQTNYGKTIAGQEAMSGWLALMNASPKDIDKLKGALEEADGTAENMANTMNDNLSGQLTILMSQLQELAISIGDILMPKIREIVSKVQGWVDKLNSLDPAQKEMIVKIGLVAAAIGPLLLAVGTLISKIGSALVSVEGMGKKLIELAINTKNGVGPLAKLGTAISGLSAPVIAVVAVIAVLVAAFVHLWNTNDEFREKVTAAWERVKTAFENFGKAISERLNAIGINFQSVTDAIKKIWDGFCQLLAPVLEAAFDAIATIVETVLNVIIGILDVFIGLFTGDWDQMWAGVKEIFSGIWNGIKGIFETVVNMLKGIADAFLGWFGTNWKSVWNGIKSFSEGLWNGIKSFFEGAWNGIKATASAVMKAISSTMTNVWNAIKSTITSVVNGIKTTVTSTWNRIKTSMTSVMNGIKSTVSSVWNGIKTTISSVVNGIKTTVYSGFNSVKSTATSIWNSIKNAITSPINSAKTAVSNAIERMKSMFHFSWSLPHLSLPHLSISGGFSIDPPSVPYFSISWYKKAMDDGMIMNIPTIFGMSGNTLMAGGEAGSETIVGTQSLMDMIRKAVAGVMTGTTINYGGVSINLYAQPNQSIEELADEIEERINNNVVRRKAAF